jgi:hypothetical protein
VGLTGGTITNTGTLSIDPTYLHGYISGLVLSTAGSSATYGISSGVANSSANAALMKLASSYTKTTGAWAVGSGNGSLDTGTIANSTWYHVFLIQRPDTGVVDVLISGSVGSPALPANYTLFRRIGSMKTDGSVHWVAFTQVGNEFIWTTPVLDINGSGLSNTSTTFTLASVPPGVNLVAKFNVSISTTAGNMLALFTSPLATTQAGNTPAGNGSVIAPVAGTAGFASLGIMTGTTQNITAVANASGGTQLTNVVTTGWNDTRGALL